MPLKSLIKLYSIPTLIVIAGVCLYYFVFLGVKDKNLKHNAQSIAQDTPQQAQKEPQKQPEILYASTQDEPQSANLATAQTTQEPQNQAPEAPQTQPAPQVATTQAPQAQDSAISVDSSQAQTLQDQIIAQAKLTQDSNKDLENPATPQPTTYALITAKSVNVRAQPDTQSAIVKRAQLNESYELVQSQNDWLEIKLNSAQHGYIAAYLAKIVEEKDLPQSAQNALADRHHTHSSMQEHTIRLYEVIARRANVRTSPIVDSAVIASIESGKKVRVAETITIDDVAWAHVLLNSGSEGYIALRLLKEVE
ncbi:hypothetical protein CQA49_06050 [Helicobacter sp. MIT 00-7814]|uniref:SH3 domain-containing protein n=1 Tax=unclassified Helicobacter TaxID=2593540 RepID=UPI000E1E66EA|nr:MULTISPECIES: SH3 domain-containing protein [unclassified Helicobacter]RDU53445.1 hypothetical protein CQA37_06960 [Helicobacter sp. MIT 99-10781]RDU53742.1 hypothetical protein CQA49_06050 [Helicobacter sp. MIT 00-7814]